MFDLAYLVHRNNTDVEQVLHLESGVDATKPLCGCSRWPMRFVSNLEQATCPSCLKVVRDKRKDLLKKGLFNAFTVGVANVLLLPGTVLLFLLATFTYLFVYLFGTLPKKLKAKGLIGSLLYYSAWLLFGWSLGWFLVS